MYTNEKAPMAGTHQGRNQQADAYQTYPAYYTAKLTQDASTWRCCGWCGEMIPGTDYYYATDNGPVCTGCITILRQIKEGNR